MAGFVSRARLGRLAAVIGFSTAALTASFVGLVALATGSVSGTLSRVPFYLLVTAAVFVAGVVLFEESRHDGRRALVAATLVAAATLFVVGFGGEGVIYALEDPEEAIRSQLFTYLLSAALIGTGVGYWAWRNVSALRSAGIGDSL
jgi:hypothetical protein